MTWRIKYNPDTRDHSRANYRGVDVWVAENQGKHFCHCGCGGVITIKSFMHAPTIGIPKYLPFHYLKTKEHLIKQVKRAKSRTGNNAAHWKGGVTKKHEILRKSKPYLAWRDAVYKRDSYTCQKCGARSGRGKTVYLHAHHHKLSFKILWKEFVAGKRTKESLFDPDLGITLCIPCHRKAHAVNSRK